MSERSWLCPVPPGDPASARVFNLIFNGLTAATIDEHWMTLSERMRITNVIYDNLQAGGVEIRLTDGLAELADVARQLEPKRPMAELPSRIRVRWRWALPPFRAYLIATAHDGHTYEVGVVRWTPWAARKAAERLTVLGPPMPEAPDGHPRA